MADVTDSERFGKRVKHSRKSHYVGTLLGARKVGTSYEVEPLPEDMREEPDRAGRGGSHTDMLSDLSRNFGLPKTKQYIRELSFDLYSKGLCPYCECKLSDTVCEKFASMVSSQATEHMEPCCPECGEWLDGFDDVEQYIESDSYISFDEEIDLDPPETELKVRAQPCGCILDERVMFWQAQVDERHTTADERIRNLERSQHNE